MLKPAALAVMVLIAADGARAAEPIEAGMTYELAKGDDPVEAFAGRGVSLAGASYIVTATSGAEYRFDRAAAGRKGLLVVSRQSGAGKLGRSQWTVVDVVSTAIDSSSVFTSKCKGGGAGKLAVAYYAAGKDGRSIGRVDASFTLDTQSGKLVTLKLGSKDCEPGDRD